MSKNVFQLAIVSLLTFVIVLSCVNNQRSKPDKRSIGKDIIEATFIDDSIADGIAKYYNNSGKVITIVNIKNGVKEGAAINYFQNGVVKDSMFFSHGKLHGIAYGYDSLGSLLFKKSYYYGVPLGHQFYYKSGNLSEYFYSDFNRNDLISCEYDSLARIRLRTFSAVPIFTKGLDEQRNPALNLFLYFPKPPDLTVVYKIGLANDKQETKDEHILQDNRLFLDTVIAYPAKEWHYYISTELKSLKDSIDKTYIQDLKGY
jgi:hypothetical protein